MSGPDNVDTREELAHAGYIAACAEIVSLARFAALVLVWFCVLAPGPIR